MDLGFNLAQSNRDLKDLTSRQNFGDTSGLLCKNDLIPCLMDYFTSPRIFTLTACMTNMRLASFPSPPQPTKKRHSIPMDASFPLCAINAERNLLDHTQSRRGVRKEPNLTGFNFSGFNQKIHNSTKVLRITSFCNCLQLPCTNKIIFVYVERHF